jgi:membrane dipeptidase
MNREQVLLDLSHAGQRTIAEGISASNAPVAITHSGCRALVDFPRNTPDAEMRALAAKGGVFGLYLMPFLRPSGQPQKEDLLRHLDHALNVCGEDHIGIGTDQFLRGRVVDDAARQRQREFFERRQRLGIAAPGEAADVFNHVDGYNDMERFERITLDLSARGWPGRRIDKLLGGNFDRLFREVWRR